jgi:hypothetical protein
MEQKETLNPENEEMNINADSDVPGNTHLSLPNLIILNAAVQRKELN